MALDRYKWRDEEYRKLINSSRWLKLRGEVLTAHPLCQACRERGMITPATEVHHITPIGTGANAEQRRHLAYSLTNLRALCHACHVEAHRSLASFSKETRKERRQLRTDEAITKLYGNSNGAPSAPAPSQSELTPGGVF